VLWKTYIATYIELSLISRFSSEIFNFHPQNCNFGLYSTIVKQRVSRAAPHHIRQLVRTQLSSHVLLFADIHRQNGSTEV
jgi:hypothetical protein